MGQSSSQAIEGRESRGAPSKLGTIFSSSAPLQSLRGDNGTAEANDAGDAGMNSKRKRDSTAARDAADDHARDGSALPSIELPTPADSHRSKKRRRRRSSVSVLGDIRSSSPLAREKRNDRKPDKTAMEASPDDRDVLPSQTFDVSTLGVADDNLESERHPLDDLDSSDEGIRDTLKTYRGKDRNAEVSIVATGLETPAPSGYAAVEEAASHPPYVDVPLPVAAASKRQVAKPSLTTKVSKKKPWKGTASGNAAKILARKEEKKKRKSPADSGYSTGSATSQARGQGQLMGVLINYIQTPTLTQDARSPSKSIPSWRLGMNAAVMRNGNNASTGIVDDASAPGIPAMDKGKGKMIMSPLPVSARSPSTGNMSLPLALANSTSTQHGKNPFLDSAIKARIRKEQERETDMLSMTKLRSRASRDAASQRISDAANIEAEIRREGKNAAKARRRAARKSESDKSKLLSQSSGTHRVGINDTAARSSPARGFTENGVGSSEGQESQEENEQVSPPSQDLAATRNSEGGADSLIDRLANHREDIRTSPQPQLRSHSSQSKKVTGANGTVGQHNEHGTFDAEMQSSMSALRRGDRVWPACDRCRDLDMDCVKNVMTCLACAKGHRKCVWKEAKEHKVLGTLVPVKVEDESAEGGVAGKDRADQVGIGQNDNLDDLREVMSPKPPAARKNRPAKVRRKGGQGGGSKKSQPHSNASKSPASDEFVTPLPSFRNLIHQDKGSIGLDNDSDSSDTEDESESRQSGNAVSTGGDSRPEPEALERESRTTAPLGIEAPQQHEDLGVESFNPEWDDESEEVESVSQVALPLDAEPSQQHEDDTAPTNGESHDESEELEHASRIMALMSTSAPHLQEDDDAEPTSSDLESPAEDSGQSEVSKGVSPPSSTGVPHDEENDNEPTGDDTESSEDESGLSEKNTRLQSALDTGVQSGQDEGSEGDSANSDVDESDEAPEPSEDDDVSISPMSAEAQPQHDTNVAKPADTDPENIDSEDLFRSPESSDNDDAHFTPVRRGAQSAPTTAKTKRSSAPLASKDRRKSAPSQQMSDIVRAQTSRTLPTAPVRAHPSRIASYSTTKSTPAPRGSGSLTKDQLAKLEEFKAEYCSKHDLDERAFADKIQENANNNRELGSFWTSIVKLVGWPPKRRPALQKAVRRIYHNYRRERWTACEDARLAHLHETLGPQWRRIADELERMPEDVRDRFRNHVKGRGVYEKNEWSTGEVAALLRAVSECAARRIEAEMRQAQEMDEAWAGWEPDLGKLVIWGTVSDRMGGTRSRLQCRDKMYALERTKKVNVQKIIEQGNQKLKATRAAEEEERAAEKAQSRSRKRKAQDDTDVEDESDDEDEGAMDDEDVEMTGTEEQGIVAEHEDTGSGPGSVTEEEEDENEDDEEGED